MRNGKLRHRVSLQKKAVTRSETSGAEIVTWQTQKTVWASIEPLSAREFIQSAAAQSSISTRITIRFINDIDASWRVVHGSTIYNIQGVLPDPKSGREYLTLPCSEGEGDGQ